MRGIFTNKNAKVLIIFVFAAFCLEFLIRLFYAELIMRNSPSFSYALSSVCGIASSHDAAPLAERVVRVDWPPEEVFRTMQNFLVASPRSRIAALVLWQELAQRKWLPVSALDSKTAVNCLAPPTNSDKILNKATKESLMVLSLIGKEEDLAAVEPFLKVENFHVRIAAWNAFCEIRKRTGLPPVEVPKF